MRCLLSLKKLTIVSCLLLAFLLFITTTTPGLKAIFFVANKIVPGDFYVQKINGKLIGDFSLEHISYRNKKIRIDIKSLQLSWDAFYLLKKKIFINHLSIDNMTVHVTPENNNNQVKVNSFSWLKYFAIQQAQIKNVTYSNEHENFILKEITLTKNKNDDAHHLLIMSPYGNLKGLVELSITPTLAWKLILTGERISPVNMFPEWDGFIDLTLKSQGIWQPQDKKVQIELTNLSGHLKNLPVKGFANFSYNNGDIEISNTQISILNADVNVEGKLSNSFAIHWQANIPSLNLFSPMAKGAVTTFGDITGTRDNPILQMNATMNNFIMRDIKVDAASGKITTSLVSNETMMKFIANNIKFKDYLVPKINIDAKLKKSNDRLIADSSITLNQGNKILANIDAPSWRSLNDFSQPIIAKITFDLKQLGELVKTKEVSDIKGNVIGNADISGSINKPVMHLNAQLNNGNIFIKRANIGINSIFLKTEYSVDHNIIVDGKFLLGKGKGNITGNISLDKPGFPALLTVNGDVMQIKKSNEYQVTFSPHLNLSYVDKKINIQGNITIPNAVITPHDFSQVTTLPNEVVIVGSEKNEQFYIPNLIMNVEIKLDKGKLQYQNLDSVLNGSLTISQTPSGLPTAVGALNVITGHYKMYGRKLDINYGRLVYAGNTLTNPGLDIRATQRFETVALAENQNQFNTSKKQLQSSYVGTNKLIVGVLVKGDIAQPKITFFSEPAGLNQNDILSYLAFGVPRSQISEANGLALLNSLASSSFSNNSNLSVDKITKKIENKLKLTELSVGSTEVYDVNKNVAEQTTTVNIARQLGPKLSVSYKAGVFTPVSILNLQYKINSYFSIQTETSNLESGVNLLYEFETD